MLAPLIRGQKGEYRDLFEDLLKQGFVRARVDGTRRVSLTDDLQLDRQMRHNIEVVIDRLVADPAARARLAEAVELALKMGEGNLIVAPEASAQSAKPRSGAAADEEARRRRDADGAQRERGQPQGRPNAGQRRRPAAFGPLRLHALRPQLRAAQPAAVQLQQPAGHVPGRATAWASCTASIRSCWFPTPKLSFKDGCIELIGPWHDLGRWRRHIYQGVADTIERKHELGQGHDARNAVERARSGAAEPVAVGHRRRAHHVHLAQRRLAATSTAASSKGIIPELLDKYRNSQEQDAAAAARKVHAASCTAPTATAQRLNPQARAVTLTTHAVRSLPTSPARSLPEVCALAGQRRRRVLQRAGTRRDADRSSPPKCSRRSAAGWAS